MFGMFFLICLVLGLFLMLFCVIYSCIFGVQRLVELIQRKWKRYLFIFGVAMIFFLLGMAFVIIPQVMVNKEKYNSNSDIFDHIDFFFEDHTKYAFSYSEENFNKISCIIYFISSGHQTDITTLLTVSFTFFLVMSGVP